MGITKKQNIQIRINLPGIQLEMCKNTNNIQSFKILYFRKIVRISWIQRKKNIEYKEMGKENEDQKFQKSRSKCRN